MSKKSSIHPGEILVTEFMKPLGLTAPPRGEGDQRPSSTRQRIRAWEAVHLG
jgi:hypothetical protein